MDSFYIWPYKYNRRFKNPYLFNFNNSLSEHYVSDNEKDRNKKWYGVFSLLVNVRSKVIIINWPENIIFQKGGIIQILAYFFILIFFKVSGKKIVWILHNKNSHNKHFYNRINKLVYFVTAKLSTNSIVHSKSGINFYKEKFNRNNISFIPHPIYKVNYIENFDNEIEWDFIIWGKIEPYKNVVEFLKYFKDSGEFKSKKIVICGKCDDLNYDQKIKSIIDDRVLYINDHLSDEKLLWYINKSKVILFTYNPISIFCSGALIFSLGTKKKIVGPEIGFFEELANENLIGTFKNYESIVEIADNLNPSIENIEDYLKKNTWERFSINLLKLLE